MTRLEKKAIQSLVDAANTIARLPVLDRIGQHDQSDAFFHIGAVQNIIASRDAIRKPKTKKR